MAKSSKMERIHALIAKLKEQAEQNASSSQMMMTVQQLQNELIGQQEVARTLGTSKVSVLMPANVHPVQYEKYAPRPETPAAPVVEKVAAPVLVEQEPVAIVQENGKLDMAFDPMLEIPTLSHQLKTDNGKRIVVDTESLNDKLKQAKTELMEVLKESPVKDLRKAVGINDRFLFINDLFRGDEAMYERSIKTINSFNIYAEAEYWISRELKVKLGWNAEDEVVAQFDQLVKRRFS